MSKKKTNGKGFKRYYEEGRVSKLKGLLAEENPYEDENVEAALAWEMGWSSIPEINEEASGC